MARAAQAAADAPAAQAWARDSPRSQAQGRVVEAIGHSPRVAAQRASVAHSVAHSVAQARPVAQRLIVNAGKDRLMNEAVKPSGWITLKTLQVGLLMDAAGGPVLEMDQLAAHDRIGAEEDVFIVGHGSAGKVADADPKVLARGLRAVLPPAWEGAVIGLTCNAGLAKAGAADSGGKQLHDALGAPVAAARGSTFTHMNIDMAIRVLKEDQSYGADFRRHYLAQLPFSAEDKRDLLAATFPRRPDLWRGVSHADIDATFERNRGSIDTTSQAFARITRGMNLAGLDERGKESRRIDEMHGEVDRNWLQYMASNPSDLRAMAAKATALSEGFYEVAVKYGEKHGLFHAVGSDQEYEYHA